MKLGCTTQDEQGHFRVGFIFGFTAGDRQMALYRAYGFSKVALTGHLVRRVKLMSTRKNRVENDDAYKLILTCRNRFGLLA